ncbi:MAG: hypothetical protein U0794_00620 [Isosphaeraceae bacterium]
MACAIWSLGMALATALGSPASPRNFLLTWAWSFGFLASLNDLGDSKARLAMGGFVVAAWLQLPALAVRAVFRRLGGFKLPSLGLPGSGGIAARSADPLDRVLFNLDRHNPFTVRDLLESVAVFGRTGSGKSSGPGRALAQAVAKLPGSGGLILVSKPEDLNDWTSIFRQQGRSSDLLVLGPGSPRRCNLLDFEQQSGSDSMALVDFLVVTGESLSEGGGGENAKFWDLSRRKLLWCAIEPIRLAWGSVTIPAIQEFILTAPQDNSQISKVPGGDGRSPLDVFRQGYHFRTMIAAGQKAKSPAENHDFSLCSGYWGEEFLRLDSKVKTSILADTGNLLHTYNTGMVREMVSTTTTVSPSDMERGKWVLLDFPVDRYQDSGRIIMSGWKLVTQRHILRRHAGPGDNVIVIHADEAQEVVSSFDAAFLAKCRSHRGCMIYLTQSINSFRGVDG